MKNKKQIILLSILSIFILFCAFGFILAPNDPNHIDMTAKFAMPCGEYPFGTDHLGRCVFSRVLYGGKTTLGIVLIGAAIVIVVGTILGLLIGQRRNGQSVMIESVLNAVTAIPPIAYLIIFIGAWGNGIPTMLTALTVSLMIRLIKLVKTKTEIEFRRAYVICAVASGASRMRVLFIHIVPNIIGDVIHYVCLSCTDMIMAIVGFSFIGLDLGDNIIDWGMMVSEARAVLFMRPDIIFYPILFIFLCTLSFNLMATMIEKGRNVYV